MEMSQKKPPDQLRTDFPWTHVTGSVLFMMLQVERVKPILPFQLLCPDYKGKTAAKGRRSLPKNSPELQTFLAISLVENQCQLVIT